jgi:hypothetical protein
MRPLAIFAFAISPLFAGSINGPGFFSATGLCVSSNNCQTLAQNNANSLSYSNTFTPNGHQLSVSWNSFVNFGSNGVFAQVMNPSLDTSYSMFLGGNTWGDDLTINAPGLTGTAGTLQVSVTVNGTGVGSEMASVGTFWQDSVGADTQLHTSDPKFTASGPVSTTFVFTVGAKFHYGSPFDFGVTLNAMDTVGLQTLVTGDFLHTGILTGLQPFDSMNNPVTGETFGSASGTNYYPTGIIPEPGTTVLMGLSAVMMALWRLRLHRSAVSK